MSYRKGEEFYLTADAQDNYGESALPNGAGPYVVNGVFTHYCKIEDAHNDPTGHPGFDRNSGCPLYEADGLTFALYEWEMQRSKP